VAYGLCATTDDPQTAADHTASVRISFAKTDPVPKRTSGGKPVQGHGSVALTNPAQGEFASKKCSNMF
jgi:hypothetical protein